MRCLLLGLALVASSAAPPQDVEPSADERLRALDERLHEVGELDAAGDPSGARELLAALVRGEDLAVLLRTPGVPGDSLLTTLQAAAIELGDLASQRRVDEARVDWLAARRAADDPELLAAKGDLATVLLLTGELRRARELAVEVRDARLELPEEAPARIQAELRVATALDALGEGEAVFAMRRRLHEIAGRALPADDELLLRCREGLAGALLARGEVERANELYGSVLEARRRALPASHPDLLAARANVARARFALGDVAGAHGLLEQCVAEHEGRMPPEHPTLLQLKANLGVARNTLGDAAGALELLEDVHAVRESVLPADHRDLLETKRSLAVAYLGVGRGLRARVLFGELLAARERAFPADHPEVLTAKADMAHVLQLFGDVAGADRLQREVVAGRERTLPPEHPDLLLAQGNLAATHKLRGELEEALALEERVLAARARFLPPDHRELLTARLNLADTRAMLGDAEGARELTAEVLGGLELRIESLLEEPTRRARAGALVELERLSSCLDLAGGGGLDARILSVLEGLRAVSVGTLRSLPGDSSNPELRALRERLARTRGRLADRSLSPPASAARGSDGARLEEWRKSLVRLAEERDALERELHARLDVSGAASRPITAARIAGGLEAGDVLLAFFRYEDRVERTDATPAWAPVTVDSLLAFVVLPDGSVTRVELGPVRALERLVRDWRSAVGAPFARRGRSRRGLRPDGAERRDPDAERAAGSALRTALLDPCLAALDEPPTRILVVPDDLVYLVPLDALPGARGGERLGDRFALRIETSARRLAAQAVEGELGERTLVALGGADYGTGPPAGRGEGEAFAALPFTLREVEAVAALHERLVGGERVVLAGAEATRPALLGSIPGARYLHVATHGWFSREALPGAGGRLEDTLDGFVPEARCGLALAGANGGVDGVLTAEALSAADLGACELAVLSACETNVGLREAGQGIQSLQTALHAAGARTAITSLWRVDDAASAELFERFYGHLWEEGLDASRALWRAKSSLRADGFSVRDWAAWVLTGRAD